MKILVVDDEPLVRKVLQRAFERAGHLVKTSSDGSDGLTAWGEFQPDIVFLDVLMPKMTGPEVLENVSAELRSQSKVILMSAFSGFQQASGGDLYLAKPFEDILEIVKMVERF